MHISTTRHCLKLVSIKRPISLSQSLNKLIYDIYGYSSDENETQLEEDGNGYPTTESVEDMSKDNPMSLRIQSGIDKSLEVEQQAKPRR